jgi:phosphoribosylformylglycinamidine cyclo-ligase
MEIPDAPGFFFVTGGGHVEPPQRIMAGKLDLPAGRGGHAQGGRPGGRHRQPRAQNPANPQTVGGVRAFCGVLRPQLYKEPVIMTGCDGVGTKLELLLEHDLLETAGKDLVAMSVNDILTTGGDPLLFLDYIGIARSMRRRSPA